MRFLLFFIFIFNCIVLQAQQPVSRHLTENDGLPDNEVYYLKQDKRGVIWISTNAGLCSYNGQQFRNYSSPLLKAKSTGCICEDSFGRIWVNNFAGQLFYVEGDSIVVVQLPGNIEISSLAPFSIGPSNELVLTTKQSKVAILKARNKQPRQQPVFSIDTILNHQGLHSIFDTKGRLWVSGGGPDTGIYNSILRYHQGRTASVSSRGVEKGYNMQRFLFEQNGKVYYFRRQENYLYEITDTSITGAVKINCPGFNLIVPLSSGKLAFCTNDGLYIGTRQGATYQLAPPLCTGQVISACYEDSRGNLWVGTLSDGLHFIPALGLSYAANPPGVPDYRNITSLIAGPEGSLLIGYSTGEVGALTAGSYRRLVPPNRLLTKAQGLFYSEELKTLTWHGDDVYQANYSGTELQLSPRKGMVSSPKDLVYIPKWNAALIASPADIQLMSLDLVPVTRRLPAGWLTKYDTLAPGPLTNVAGERLSMFLSKERGRAVYFDDATNTCWGSDKNGIVLHRENSESSITWKNEPVYATSFCYYKGVVYAGTFSQGLIAIRNEKAERQITINVGLASNTIYKVLAGKDHLWIITDKGVQYYNPDNASFYLLDKTTGLPGFKINGAVLAGNVFYLSTPGGLLQVPDTISFRRDTGIQVFLRAVYCNRKATDTLLHRFAVRENSFSFSVETPTYANRALLRYRYRLKGVDPDFQTVTLDNDFFEYRSLQSGHYVFELQLTGTDGKISGNPLVYEFYINPPFYKTIWFRLLISVILILLTAFLFRARLRQVQRREQEKLRLAKLESELNRSQLAGIKAQMNPHFMFNALNSIQEFILLNDKKSANMYMGKFADLMRMTLDMSNRQDVLLEDEIKMLQLYLELEALRFEDSFHWSVTTDPAVESEHLRIPAMLIQPHIENAVKHGLLHRTGDKQLDVHFSLPENTLLLCTITDNGIGRKRSEEINAQRMKKHTSFATGAMQKRIALLNAQLPSPIMMEYEDLADTSGQAAGTRVILRIPVST